MRRPREHVLLRDTCELLITGAAVVQDGLPGLTVDHAEEGHALILLPHLEDKAVPRHGHVPDLGFHRD